MSEIESVAEPPIGVIPIHFDVPRHYLPLTTFVETATKTRSVIDAFNREFFDGQLQYELLVFPPDDGSFMSRLGIVLLAGWGVVWSFTGSDIGKGFIKGLTNHTPEYWAEQAGTYLQTKLLQLHKKRDAAASVAPTAAQVRCQFETTIIAESTKSFLQSDQSDLQRVGITTRKFRDAFEARNGFYQACAADQKLSGIGFDESENFPIKRKDFARLQVSLLPREDEPGAVEWQVEIVILKVTSPNWDREDRQRQWKARDERGRERYFRIEDEQFWSLVQGKQINPHIIDTVKVQMAFVGEQRRNARVLRVLEYNDQVLGDPLDENALAAMLGVFNRQARQERGLFDN